MRITQFIGLSKKAEEYIKENAVMVMNTKCPCCGSNTHKQPDCIEYEKVTGMFEEEVYALRRIKHKDGGTFEEVVQAEPWSSGPVIFLCLKRNGKLICKWPQKEINNA